MNLMYADRLLKHLDDHVMETLLQATTNLLMERKICSRSLSEGKPVLIFPSIMKKGETRTGSASAPLLSSFDKLLAWLSPDRENAGARYEEIRRRLINVFQHRGATSSEDLADETIERVTKKVDQIADNYVGDPARYFYGVAKNVYLEYARKSVAASLPPIPTESFYDRSGALELEHECLERCLESLSQNSRELILQYYSEQKQAKLAVREQMSERLEIPLNALRVRVLRIRKSLEACIRDCIARER